MSIIFSLCLLVHRSSLLSGLTELTRFFPTNTPDLKSDPWTISRQSLTTEAFTRRLALSKQPVFAEAEIFRLGLRQHPRDEGVLLWTSTEMQELFQLTSSNDLLLLSLSAYLRKNQNFIQVDHPDFPLILKVFAALKPIYGWMEADFAGTQEDYAIWNPQISSFPSSMAPWHLAVCCTWVFGTPFSAYVKPQLNFSNSGTHELYSEDLGDELFFVTQLDESARSDENRRDALDAEITGLEEALRSIPASILE